MKRFKWIIVFFLFLILFILRIFLHDIYLKVKNYASKEFSLYGISYLYINDLNDKSKEVASVKKVEVEDYQIINDKYYVVGLNQNVIFPFNGIVTEKKDNFIKIETNFKASFYIENLKPNVFLYQVITENEIIGTSNKYTIWANNQQMDYINYSINYEEI